MSRICCTREDRQISTVLPVILFFLSLCAATLAFGQEPAKSRGLNWINHSNSKASEITSNTINRAIVIGNNLYSDDLGVWTPLSTAVNDAQSLAKLLSFKYGFEDVFLLLDATRQEMLSSLRDLANRTKKNDTVLIFYAGHGFLDLNQQRGYWIPVDAKGNDVTSFIRNSTIREELKRPDQSFWFLTLALVAHSSMIMQNLSMIS